MIDVIKEIEAATRHVGEGRVPAGTGRSVRLEREYDAPIEDVWDAITSPERISRWFLPISGDFRVGGRYQLEGNAGGQILACERPHRVKVSWVYGDADATAPNASEVELRLSTVGGGRTRFELEHIAVVPDEMWEQFGPGAVGVGWDGGLLGLTLHLRGETVGDPIAWQLGPEGREFNRRSAAAWGDADRASGTHDDAVATRVANTIGFYVPEAEAGT
jgi:uncharacterized protein YndB with AHSA1/START domain